MRQAGWIKDYEHQRSRDQKIKDGWQETEYIDYRQGWKVEYNRLKAFGTFNKPLCVRGPTIEDLKKDQYSYFQVKIAQQGNIQRVELVGNRTQYGNLPFHL